jgi:hypothetical protein
VRNLVTFRAGTVDPGRKALFASGCVSGLEPEVLAALLGNVVAAWFEHFDSDPSSSPKSELGIVLSIEAIRRVPGKEGVS